MPGVYGQLGVVIRTEPSNQINGDSFGARSSLTGTYAQVQADLEKALELLPETRGGSGPDRSRVIKATARALLSRLHLYLREYDKAAQYADAVIADARYALVKPYAAIFRTKNSAESVFEMQYGTNDVSGLRNWYFPAALGGRGGLALHEEFYAQLTADPNDERGSLVAFNAGAGVYYPTKYDLAGNASDTHMIRIAELYLNRAEARAHLNNLEGARADLNAVGNRAGLTAAAATGQQLPGAILEERKPEFYQEGHRWFDLLRTGNPDNTELTEAFVLQAVEMLGQPVQDEGMVTAEGVIRTGSYNDILHGLVKNHVTDSRAQELLTLWQLYDSSLFEARKNNLEAAGRILAEAESTMSQKRRCTITRHTLLQAFPGE